MRRAATPAASRFPTLRFTPEQIISGPNDSEIEQKIEALTPDFMSYSERRRLLDVLWHLDEIPDAARVIELLRI